jgi:hypothetical protein
VLGEMPLEPNRGGGGVVEQSRRAGWGGSMAVGACPHMSCLNRGGQDVVVAVAMRQRVHQVATGQAVDAREME